MVSYPFDHLAKAIQKLNGLLEESEYIDLQDFRSQFYFITKDADCAKFLKYFKDTQSPIYEASRNHFLEAILRIHQVLNYNPLTPQFVHQFFDNFSEIDQDHIDRVNRIIFCFQSVIDADEAWNNPSFYYHY